MGSYPRPATHLIEARLEDSVASTAWTETTTHATRSRYHPRMVRGREPKPLSRPTPAVSGSVPPASGNSATDGTAIPRLYDDDPEPSRTGPTDIARMVSGFNCTVKTSPVKRALFMVMSGSNAGGVLQMGARKVTIGRSRQADFTLADEGVSRMHCGVSPSGSTYVLTDLGSTHGTTVNGKRVERAELKPGDRIQLGPNVLLEFDVCDAAEQGVIDKLYEGATRDPLTRALNRRAFEERLAADVSYAVRHTEGLCAVALEIDALEGLVAKLGGPAGDIVLREVAGAIASMLRRDDVLARTGSNGFVVLGRGLTREKGAALAERICSVVAGRSIALPTTNLQVTVSAGVAELGECAPPRTGIALLDLAGANLAAARPASKNESV